MPNEIEKVTRKLRAILSADVKGYSLLMADDEVHTIQTLKAYRSLMSNVIQQHSGRVVDNPGDNLLAEFSSAVDAVECAVKIQDRLKKENSKFAEGKRLQFRIGINIGDVVQDDERIYGSGVNVAARIEGIADPGGVCISRNTYDHVKDKLDCGFDYLGEHDVKNIQEPVRVYKILMDAESPKPLAEEELDLPDKPSIAVLPFTNMSGDPSQEYFSDGLTEQIINGLCKVSNLFVIARNSSFTYKGKAISVKQIAKELGVRYILEGSVQRANDRVRITAQLIDATTDYHMWSEHYDRDLEDIFAVQDEITMKLISVMEVNLVYGEQARLWAGVMTGNIRAYERCIRAYECYQRYTEHDTFKAIGLAEESIALDKKYPYAYVVLGLSHWSTIQGNYSESPFDSFNKAEECGKKAFALTETFDLTYILMGFIELAKRNHDEAIEHQRTALKLNPNGAYALASLSYVLSWAGRSDEAIPLIKRAFRLNPVPPTSYYITLAMALRFNGQYEESIEVCKNVISISPDSFAGYAIMTVAYSLLKDYDKARKSAEEILKIYPSYSIDAVRLIAPFKHESSLNEVIEAFRKAGIPDTHRNDDLRKAGLPD